MLHPAVVNSTHAHRKDTDDLIIIRDSKFGKSRLVPIDHRLGVVLQKYAEMKHAANNSQNQHSAFFVKRNGLPPTLRCVETTFRRLCNLCGIRREDGARYQPRLHDIRHNAELRIMPSKDNQPVRSFS